jgi:Na+-transporting NADH:ubiquinone oxidoreductase subunit NqrF
MNVQALPKYLSDAYAMFDSLNLSVTALVAMGLILTIVFLFAIREAASWFFKIDDIKQDVKKVRQLVVDMEAEVRTLQSLLTQNIKLASPGAPEAGAATTQKSSRALAASESEGGAVATKQTAEEKPQPRFSVTH